MKISEFLHLALPEEQWLPTTSDVLRQFAEERCYVYKRQPCWYSGKRCSFGDIKARLTLCLQGRGLFLCYMTQLCTVLHAINLTSVSSDHLQKIIYLCYVKSI